MSKIRVGIPRALLYYQFAPLWKTFFDRLGCEVVVSPPSNPLIKHLAISKAPDEDCYSSKLYFGHTLALRDKCDVLFIPRYQSDHPTSISCPKFMGLADVLRSMFPDLPHILRPYFSISKGHHSWPYFWLLAFSIGWRFSKNPFRVVHAISAAIHAYRQHNRKKWMSLAQLHRWEQNHSSPHPAILPNAASSLAKSPVSVPIKIALVGHTYVLHDELQSLNIQQKLEDFGCEIITSEQMPRRIIEREMAKLEYDLYFQYEREILGTIMHFLNTATIDGIIHIMIFSCGPDSVAGELANRIAHRKQTLPLLQLTFDELTGEAGLNTRLEAFIDMIIRKKQLSLVTPPPALPQEDFSCHLPIPTSDP